MQSSTGNVRGRVPLVSASVRLPYMSMKHTKNVESATTARREKRKTRKSAIYGTLGAFARKIMWRSYTIGIALLVAGAGTAGAVYRTTGAQWSVGFLLAGFVLANPFLRRGSQARVGIRSEKRALTQLRKAKVHAIVCGSTVGGYGDVDLIAVGPQLVAVEVKTGRGRVKVLKGGRIQAGRRVIPKNPLQQVTANAVSVARATGHTADRVICVVDMTGGPLKVTQRGSVTWICSGVDLPMVVSSLPARVYDGDVMATVKRLAD